MVFVVFVVVYVVMLGWCCGDVGVVLWWCGGVCGGIVVHVVVLWCMLWCMWWCCGVSGVFWCLRLSSVVFVGACGVMGLWCCDGLVV